MTNNTIALKANPRFFRQALRNMGWDVMSSLSEMIDNSIDAGATEIKIVRTKQKDKMWSYSIHDNGCGMTPKELQTALELSPDLDYEDDAIGHYGVGLTAAIFCVSSKGQAKIITNKGGEASMVDFDVDNVCHTKPHTIKSNEPSGTSIFLPNCTENTQESQLLKYLGATYFPASVRNKKLKIYFNDIEVEFLDPFYRGEKDHFVEHFDSFDIDGHTIEVSARLFDNDNFTNFSKYDTRGAEGKFRKPGSGVYYRLNNRYIQLGNGNIPFVSYQMQHNPLRIEVNVPKEVMEEFGISVNKSKVKVNESNSKMDTYKNVIKDVMKFYRSNSKYNKKNKVTPTQLQNLNKSIQSVNKKLKQTQNNFLTNVKVPHKTHAPTNPTTPKGTKNRPSGLKYNKKWVDVKVEPLGSKNNYFDYSRNYGCLEIVLNEDHPFTSEFLKVSNVDKMDMSLFQIYSLVKSIYELEEKHECVSGGLKDDLIETQSDFFMSLYL